MIDLTGQTLGQYTIIDQIGHGGMASVFRAHQHSVDREVAIKVLPPSMMHVEGFRDRFYKEVEIVAHLQHPHIMPVYDFGEQEGLLYIVMAYISGGTLSGAIKQGPVEPTRTAALIRQIASALDYAHGQGIIHRDIKPSNVLLDTQGNAYLADFGLARAVDAVGQLTKTGMIGTPAYMAPDLADPRSVGPKVDIYALAVILFEMLTGHLPYESDSALGLIMAHASRPIPDLKEFDTELPAGLQGVIERGMAKSPDSRYATAGRLADDLEAVVSGRQAETAVGLVFTDADGRVIFADGYFLKMTHRSLGQARMLLGMPIHELLGIDPAVTQKLLADINKIGQVSDQAMTIVDATGAAIMATCSGTATHDEKGHSIGADLSLRHAVAAGEADARLSTPSSLFDTGEREYIHQYIAAHINSLRVLLIRMGGQRPADRLQEILNETAQRNDWPIEMESGQLNFGPTVRTDAYRALVSKALTYTASLLGKRAVIRQMDAVDEQLGERGKQLDQELNLRQILEDIGG